MGWNKIKTKTKKKKKQKKHYQHKQRGVVNRRGVR